MARVGFAVLSLSPPGLVSSPFPGLRFLEVRLIGLDSSHSSQQPGLGAATRSCQRGSTERLQLPCSFQKA